MLQLKPLDESVPIFQQIGAEASPVVLVNVFQVAKEDIPALLTAWEADANWMKQQPGLHLNPIASRNRRQHRFSELCAVGVVAHFRAAFTHPEFKQALAHYPSSAVASPHLFTRLTVPNLCVGP